MKFHPVIHGIPIATALFATMLFGAWMLSQDDQTSPPPATISQPKPHVFSTPEYAASLDKRLRYAKTYTAASIRLMNEAGDTLRYDDRQVIGHITDVLHALTKQVQQIEDDLAVLRKDILLRTQSRP